MYTDVEEVPRMKQTLLTVSPYRHHPEPRSFAGQRDCSAPLAVLKKTQPSLPVAPCSDETTSFVKGYN